MITFYCDFQMLNKLFKQKSNFIYYPFICLTDINWSSFVNKWNYYAVKCFFQKNTSLFFIHKNKIIIFFFILQLLCMVGQDHLRRASQVYTNSNALRGLWSCRSVAVTRPRGYKMSDVCFYVCCTPASSSSFEGD